MRKQIRMLIGCNGMAPGESLAIVFFSSSSAGSFAVDLASTTFGNDFTLLSDALGSRLDSLLDYFKVAHDDVFGLLEVSPNSSEIQS